MASLENNLGSTLSDRRNLEALEKTSAKWSGTDGTHIEGRESVEFGAFSVRHMPSFSQFCKDWGN